MLALTLVFVATGLLLMGLAVPLARRRVPPNDLYGLRVPATRRDDVVWYEANARSGRDLFALGALVVGCAVALPLATPVTADAYGLGMSALLVVGAVGSGVVGWRRANRLLAERQREHPPGGGTAG